ATVRIAAEKLDALLARNGELLVARRRVQSRAEELVALREAAGRWRVDWQRVEKPLSQLLAENTNGRPSRLTQALGKVGRRLRKLEKELERLSTSLVSDSRQIDAVAGALEEEVRRARMLPFAEACRGLDRAAHDLAQAAGKEVALAVEGGDVELDRSV